MSLGGMCLAEAITGLGGYNSTRCYCSRFVSSAGLLSLPFNCFLQISHRLLHHEDVHHSR